MRSRRVALAAGAAAVITAVALVFMVSADEPEVPGSADHEGPRRSVQDPPSDEGASTEPARAPIVVDTRRQQLIGVRTVRAERRHSAVDVQVAGVVAYDETRQVEITARVDGWVRDLRANYTGIAVRRGERLFTLYSPELLATENEYLLALAGLRQHGQNPTLPETRDHALRLVQATRDRLTLWEVSDAEIEALEKRGKALGTTAFVAPRAGVVVDKDAVEGMRVTAGQRLFRIVDLSSVWVEASVPEREIRLVRPGQPATARLDAYPGETFRGVTAYIHPSVAADTRTVTVRLQLPNADGRLRPGMYANVTIPTDEGMALVVPIDAVVDGGTQQLVFIAAGDGYFTPRPVGIGRRFGDAVEVVEGLREGETVASGATFFLDSESQMRAVQNYAPAAASAAPAARAAGSRASSLDVTFRPRPDPPRAGMTTFEVTVREGGTPVTDAKVSAVLFMPAMPSMNMPAHRSDAALAPAGGGTYRGEGHLSMAGRWDVTVTVTRAGRPADARQFSLVAR